MCNKRRPYSIIKRQIIIINSFLFIPIQTAVWIYLIMINNKYSKGLLNIINYLFIYLFIKYFQYLIINNK